MMLRLNVIMLVNETGEKVLMCRRLRNPYKGLYNFVGGKVDENEDGLHAAYRELREETGVTAADVCLHHLATFSYMSGGAGLPPYELQAYVGRLRHAVVVEGDENPLEWQPMEQDFFDTNRFAGEGSVGHIVESVRHYRADWLEAEALQLSIEPITEANLPVIAYYQNTTAEALAPMLMASQIKRHEGRYYEQFAIWANGCHVGLVSLFEQEDGTVSDGVDVFPPFRRCGFAHQALTRLLDVARQRGFAVQTAQIRTDNTASIALHGKLGFVPGKTWINRRGHEVRTWRKELL